MLVSVLEASATKRDAKGYLQKYTPKLPKSPVPEEALDGEEPFPAVAGEPENVAVVLLRTPQDLSDDILDGVAHTLVQLRSLGLLSTVVLDCGVEADKQVFSEQSVRLCEAIDSYGKPATKFVDEVFYNTTNASDNSKTTVVDDRGMLSRAFERGLISVVPSLAARDTLSATSPADASSTAVSLIKFMIGRQKAYLSGLDQSTAANAPPIASVERIIILDPFGATPMSGNKGVCHRFINLEQEYDGLVAELKGPNGSPLGVNSGECSSNKHAANLSLARDALYTLPPASSALITTPYAAASTHLQQNTSARDSDAPIWGFDGMVTTRKRQNPLLHNLLTDKPLFSSSLPFQRVANGSHQISQPTSTAATLIKIGTSLNLYPDPRQALWSPPKPGETRPRLTDSNVDLPRLVHLIEDSFGRKIDVEDYLNRVKDNLAGIIIAGEYEGGAILTWEKPDHLTEQEAYDQRRYVPYLDKFAVLRSRQGSGGVADIVFNSMVRDCFPYGVCWRSRKNNPVNKWYFERSSGTSKLSDSNWTMFWTTPGLESDGRKLQDYEAVCRAVQPSWADNKHIVD